MFSLITSLRDYLRRGEARAQMHGEELKGLRADIAGLGAKIDAMAGRLAEAANRPNLAPLDIGVDQLIASDPRYRQPLCLNHSAGQVFSQVNEDGIIAEIFRRIGAGDRTFVEIAAGNGIENTTRLLLQLGWTGLWVEGDASEAASIRANLAEPLRSGALRFVESFVDAQMIDELIASNLLDSRDIDLLSLDIDYNTSHVWSAIQSIRPRVVCIEYNAHYPASVDFEVPYDPQARWNGATRFGASLKALERIGRAKGYSLVACDIYGVNAFFVRDDLCTPERFLAPFTAETHYEPPRYSLVHMRGHARDASASL